MRIRLKKLETIAWSKRKGCRRKSCGKRSCVEIGRSIKR